LEYILEYSKKYILNCRRQEEETENVYTSQIRVFNTFE